MGVTSRSRWAAVGAAVAVCLGAGGLGVVGATISSGARSVFVPITPCRLVDTRPAPTTVGSRATPLGPAEIATFVVHGANGNCSIPAGATSIASNVTITAPTSDGFLTLFPSDATLPNASNLNWSAGQAPTPNAVTVDLSADGRINVFNERGTVNVIIDIVGYYEDHNHDDRYYTKAQADGALATKANAADVYTKAEINASTASALRAAGFVNSTGAVFGGHDPIGTWTSSSGGAGSYQIALPGLSPGCGADLWPVVTVTAHSSSLSAELTGMSCSGGNVGLSIRTFNPTTNVATSSAFMFTVHKAPSTSLTPADVDGPNVVCTTDLADVNECVVVD